jgi:hypothetical protein
VTKVELMSPDASKSLPESTIVLEGRDEKVTVDLLHPDAGAFLGAFMSEGNLTEGMSVKITCKDIEFLDAATHHIQAVIGKNGATEKRPTNEHKKGGDGFHKYYSKTVATMLTEGYGVKPGRKVLNNDGLPEVLMKNAWNPRAKMWFVRYLQMRFSGDGHVRNGVNSGKYKDIITRRVALSRNMSLRLGKRLLGNVEKSYERGKPLKRYPRELVDELKTEMRRGRNFPKELDDISQLLSLYFGISSRVYPYGVRCIYYDRKKDRYIASAIYKLVISRREDIQRFQENVGFADFDLKNNTKLLKLRGTYKNRLRSTQRGLLAE